MKRKIISFCILLGTAITIFLLLLVIRNYYKAYDNNLSRYGSGNLSSKSYLVETTGCLQLKGTFRLNIIQSNQSMVTIKVDENLIPFIEVKSYAGCLLVQALPGYLIKPSQPMEVIVRTKKFSKLNAKGNIVFDARNIDTKSINLNLSGNTYGHLEGKAKNMLINASGSASLHAINFNAQDITINAAGSANLFVSSYDSLSIKANGDVKIVYKGEPSLSTQLTNSVRVMPWQKYKQGDNIRPTLVETIVGK
ncbi:DUF2807 domain-containing protein [Thiotrichales bacterium 19S11-10]|nr:DUF2807 domain-containing protein [Thiotrichales bacterium 19S11-10]MCF6807470.1 DUF2807 domain-containing protein [Thiotrichales bacterium 19S9-11]MCF6811439.1 DUF2807 domain-containing protein [Thiotrichales bacterium 19S9-12]